MSRDHSTNGAHRLIQDAPRAEPGTVCAGSLRDRDLLSAFAGELRRLQGIRVPQTELMRRCRSVLETGGEIDDVEAMDLLAELTEALDDLAPVGHYFGAHPGDGSDFGFWPYSDTEEDTEG